MVEAFKIFEITALQSGEAALDGRGDTSVTVSAAYVAKHSPKGGGYYVRYADGYESWSPADAFEGGYTLVADTDDA